MLLKVNKPSTCQPTFLDILSLLTSVVTKKLFQAPRDDFFSTPLVKDRKWENLPAGFKELKLDKMDGKNLLNKLELLMAALSN